MFAHRITLFRLFGFAVRVDPSWLLLAILITWSLAAGYFPYVAPGLSTVTYWWMGVAGLIGLAFSIVVHEYAHALVAKRYDMPIHGITLFVFGGVAEMQEEPSSPKGEFWMAIAGPITSVAVALLFFLLAGWLAGPEVDVAALSPPVAVASYLAFINALLAAFNMLPAFPLDGGRVLRSALWAWKGDILWATRIAAASGSLFAFVLIALGLYSVLVGNFIGGIWWFLLGLFVRAAATSTVQRQVARSVLAGQPVHRFMRRDPIAVDPELTLERLVDGYFYTHYYKSFPVAEGDRLVGCVDLDAVKKLERRQWPLHTVRSIMEPCEGVAIDEAADAAQALEQMQRTGRSRLLVTRGGRLVGVLALRDLLNYLELRMDLDRIDAPASSRMP